MISLPRPRTLFQTFAGWLAGWTVRRAPRRCALPDPAPTRPDLADDVRPDSADDWCPAHETWHGPEEECPGCREEWAQTWVTNDEPDGDADLAAWLDECEAAAEEAEGGWYRDMIRRAGGERGYREGGDL